MTDEPTNTNAEIIPQPQEEDIKSLILPVRGMQVLLDSDVARLYGYETKAINLAAKRNADRFPPEFRFQLTDDELDHILRFQTETSNNVSAAAPEKRGGRRYPPYVYSSSLTTTPTAPSLTCLLRNSPAWMLR